MKECIRMIVWGLPGLGKSTLAMSSPDPVIIDADGGYDRVMVRLRKPVIPMQGYDEILKDICVDNHELKQFKTIVIDTGGSLFNLMKPWVIKNNPVNAQKDGVTLSLKGYGAVAAEFDRFTKYCVSELHKHIIVIFHAKERNDGDSVKYRIDIEGQTAHNIWKPMDMGGFMEMIGNNRTIGFSPTERYDAKGTHGISNLRTIPDVSRGGANDFLTRLFDEYNANISEEAKVFSEYDAIMNQAKAIIKTALDEKSTNEALSKLAGIEFIFSGKMEAWTLLQEQAKKVGLVFKNGAFHKSDELAPEKKIGSTRGKK